LFCLFLFAPHIPDPSEHRCDPGYRDDDCSKLDSQVIYLQTTIATIVLIMSIVIFGVFTFSYMIAKKYVTIGFRSNYLLTPDF
jgi:hypothetical protein